MYGNHMLRITLRFYGNLNNLLWEGSAGPTVTRQLPAPTSVKDLIEGCGVPHTEVDLILANGQSVDFSYLVQENQQISVYPFFNHFDIPASDRLQKQTLPYNRFLADENVGKLARYLRMAGFDTAYVQEKSDKEIIDQMLGEQRALLSRDRKLLMHNVVEHGYLPRSDDPAEQLREICHRFDLFEHVQPFSRCPNCNGLLESVSKEEIIDRLEPLTKKHFNNFSQCPDCGQIYWAGSHRRRLDERVKKMLNL